MYLIIKGYNSRMARWRRCIEQGMWEWTWSFHVSSGLTILWGLLCLSCCSVTGCVWFFATSCTAARQASLSITNFQSLLKLMSIESVMPSNRLILYRPCLLPPSIFPSLRVFSTEFFASGGQSVGFSASASVLPMNTQDWFPLQLTGWISLHFKGLSWVFSNTTLRKHQFFSTQPPL